MTETELLKIMVAQNLIGEKQAIELCGLPIEEYRDKRRDVVIEVTKKIDDQCVWRRERKEAFEWRSACGEFVLTTMEIWTPHVRCNRCKRMTLPIW